MWWSKQQSEVSLREQLISARAALINQIAILEAGPLRSLPGESEQFRAQAADLRTMLEQIEDRLSEADAGDR